MTDGANIVGSTLTGFYNQTIDLGQNGYTSPLTIASSGFINVDTYGGAGVYVGSGMTSPTVSNFGSIFGGYGGSNGISGFARAGGAGVDVLSAGNINNYGVISGGGGGGGTNGRAYAGGDGVDLSGGGTFYNSGTVTGGLGGYDGAHGFGGDGGAGVDLSDGGFIINTGAIDGGAGGGGDDGDTGVLDGGNGGAAVILGAGAQMENDGTLTGGVAGTITDGFGGDGVDMGAAAKLYNAGDITGGGPANGATGTGAERGGWGVFARAAATITNAGSITGGCGSYFGGSLGNTGAQGGVGVELYAGGVVNNFGAIAGGAGGAIGAADLSGSCGTGGTGIYLNAGGTLTNSGTVTGGAGAAVAIFGSQSSQGGTGGVGVDLKAGGSLVNHGIIRGGAGGYNYYNTGKGGAGLSLNHGGVVTNTGTIVGGMGASGYYGGRGGVGVYLNGGTLINSGLIEGGSGGVSISGKHQYGESDAVQFGTLAGTLVLEPGEAVGGEVVANTHVNDVLELAGTGPATLVDLGTLFTGFSTLNEVAGANWTLSGPESFNGQVNVDGTMQLNGNLTGTGTVTVAAGHVLSGFGTLALATVNNGTLAVSGGALTLTHAVTGSGVLQAASGANLVLRGGGTLSEAVSGAGTLSIEAALVLARTASIATNVIDTVNLTLGSGANLTIGTGRNFALTAASGKIIELGGASGDKATNHGTLTADGAGTAEVGVAFVNAGKILQSAGTLAFLGATTNSGTVDLSAGTMVMHDTVGGTGKLEIGATGTLSLLAGAGGGQTTDFLARSGLLELTKPLDFAGFIEGFAASDRIDLAGATATSFSYASGVLTITDSSTVVAKLHFDGSYTQSDFKLTSDGHAGTNISFI